LVEEIPALDRFPKDIKSGYFRFCRLPVALDRPADQ
jgi:hypothetical protein